MPLWVYRDWLADNGWNVDGLEEEMEFTVQFSRYDSFAIKTLGQGQRFQDGYMSTAWEEENLNREYLERTLDIFYSAVDFNFNNRLYEDFGF